MNDQLRAAALEALQHPVVLSVGLFALVFALWLLSLLGRRQNKTFKVRMRPLLTPNELDFAQRLSQAVEPEHRLLTQVSMGALLEPDLTSPEMSSNPGWFMSIRARYSQKVVDFVVTTYDFEPLVLIELDDRTHDTRHDAWRDHMTAAAGYVTLRYESRSKPTVQEIQNDVNAILCR